MKTELEILFFESTIIDIDFSQWRKYLQLVIISEWINFNKEIIPLKNVNIIKFNDLREFHCKSNLPSSEGLLESPGISVSNINEYGSDSVKNLIIEGSAFDFFSIKYSYHEIISNDDEIIKIPRKNIENRLFLKNRCR